MSAVLQPGSQTYPNTELQHAYNWYAALEVSMRALQAAELLKGLPPFCLLPELHLWQKVWCAPDMHTDAQIVESPCIYGCSLLPP